MSRGRAAALACCLAAAGCGSPATPPEPAAAQGELRQFRSDIAARRLQVTLTAQQPLTVTSVALAVEGFGRLAPTVVDAALPVGSPLDLPVPYGAADCAAAPGRAVASLTTADGRGPVVLTLADRGLVARLHAAECAERALAEQVELSVDPGWTQGVRDGRPALTGTLRLRRLRAGERVVVDGLGANVVFSVRSDRTGAPLLVLGPDELGASLLVVLVPQRCEAHALAESKRTSLLAAYVGLGDRPPRLTTVTPDPAARARIEAFAVEGCRGAGTAKGPGAVAPSPS